VVEQDYAEAEKWYKEAFNGYKKAAEKGNIDAQVKLGDMYSSGVGVAKNKAEAVKWYKKATEKGNAKAQYNLGRMYKGENNAESLKWYIKAAEQGYAEAQSTLIEMYEEGDGVKQDYREAFKWRKKFAETSNDVHLHRRLGEVYYYGDSEWGVAQDYTEALKWFKKAADDGYRNEESAQSVDQAICYLGIMYEKGQGVAKNNAEAVKWYKKVVEEAGGNGVFLGEGLFYPKERLKQLGEYED
jgi:TPR repeat protein